MSGKETFQPGSAPLSQDERDALERLKRVHGPGGLKSALLAMMLGPDQPRRLLTWQEETVLVADAETIQADMARLSGAARLPWFELVLQRLAGAPLPDRQTLLRAVRRLLTVPGEARPIDRLLWLTVRRAFGETPWAAARVPAEVDIAQLPDIHMLDLAHFTAHLARLVPSDDQGSDAGPLWYLSVMSRWQPAEMVAPFRRPDVDEVVRALAGLQALSWMQRPLLVRAWVGEALHFSRNGQLARSAADALRLSCALLDSPMPPEVARHYIALIPEKSP
jgi:hypothetical protein